MNSIFSSFDAVSAEFMCQSLGFFNNNTKSPPAAATVQDDQKKVKHDTTGRRPSSKGGYSARWAPELDGLHCFESLVFH
ncbi:hypothetical protein Ccrd_006233 [Cynara cardunculus var. scolymus]|uniref:Uncharacterized protein n=1 Tax=Cynara cardunculus var. scolymus TaxID=59895 RepID=A0A118JUB0_CYNCS|nr:hypothetical protein Ccrd_006233 [Cynara cardunculus var. scolymus]